jgi:hypothetical protein
MDTSSTDASARNSSSSSGVAGNATELADFEPSSDPNAPRIALNGPRFVDIAQLGSYERCVEAAGGSSCHACLPRVWCCVACCSLSFT